MRIGGVSDSSLFNLSSQIYCLQQEQQQKPLQPLPHLQRQIILRQSRCGDSSGTATEEQAKGFLLEREDGVEASGTRVADERDKRPARAEETYDGISERLAVAKEDGDTSAQSSRHEEFCVRRWSRPSRKVILPVEGVARTPVRLDISAWCLAASRARIFEGRRV